MLQNKLTMRHQIHAMCPARHIPLYLFIFFLFNSQNILLKISKTIKLLKIKLEFLIIISEFP